MNDDGFQDYKELKEWLIWGVVFTVSVVSFVILVI